MQHSIKAGREETLAKKNCYSQTEDRSDSQSENRTIQGPDDSGQNPEVSAIGVPGGAAEKTQTVAANRRHRLPRDADNQAEDDNDREPCDGERTSAEYPICGDLYRCRRLRYLLPGQHERFISRMAAGMESIAYCSGLAWGHEISFMALVTASTTFPGSGI